MFRCTILQLAHVSQHRWSNLSLSAFIYTSKGEWANELSLELQWSKFILLYSLHSSECLDVLSLLVPELVPPVSICSVSHYSRHGKGIVCF